jgi:hypothetical protein
MENSILVAAAGRARWDLAILCNGSDAANTFIKSGSSSISSQIW